MFYGLNWRIGKLLVEWIANKIFFQAHHNFNDYIVYNLTYVLYCSGKDLIKGGNI